MDHLDQDCYYSQLAIFEITAVWEFKDILLYMAAAACNCEILSTCTMCRMDYMSL